MGQTAPRKFDAIIIGAGPAGNFLAWELAKRGLTPLVVETHRRVGQPVQCAGIMSQKLDQLVALPREVVVNRVRRARVVSPSGKSVSMEGRDRPYVIDRAAFDEYLFREAKAAGARYRLGERFLGFRRLRPAGRRRGRTGGGTVRVKTTAGTYEAPLLAGCDGPLSHVARSCGVRNRTIYGTQVRVEFDEHERDVASMHFSPDWGDLFAWVVPEGDGVCRVGLGTATHPRRALAKFLSRLGLEDRRVIDRQAGLIPVGHGHQSAFDGVCLLGDAAGQVKATTGGGVVMHLSAGRILADAVDLIHERHGGNYSKRLLERYYQRPCDRSVGRQLKVHYLIRVLLNGFTAADWDYLLDLYENTPVGRIFNLYGEMDFPKRFLARLLRDRRITRLLVSILWRNWRQAGGLLKLLR
ncbi:MAG: geranylgeranyl reductase family protein [Promethearchaeota archaeon]